MVAPSAARMHLHQGDLAPEFTLPSTTGQDVALSALRGRNNVVLAFYAAAFTSPCTELLQALQVRLGELEGTDTQVFAVSTDNVPAQQHFAEQLKITFPMLSDFRTREVSEDYGVLLAETGSAHHTIFVIDKEGRIQYIQEWSQAGDFTGVGRRVQRIGHEALNPLPSWLRMALGVTPARAICEGEQ